MSRLSWRAHNLEKSSTALAAAMWQRRCWRRLMFAHMELPAVACRLIAFASCIGETARVRPSIGSLTGRKVWPLEFACHADVSLTHSNSPAPPLEHLSRCLPSVPCLCLVAAAALCSLQQSLSWTNSGPSQSFHCTSGSDPARFPNNWIGPLSLLQNCPTAGAWPTISVSVACCPRFLLSSEVF